MSQQVELPGNEVPLEIHIKIKKRTGRTHLTSVEGLDKLERPEGMKLDIFLKKLTSKLKKKFICGAFIEENNIITLNGDHRDAIKDFLVKEKFATEQQIKVHGF